MSSASRWSSSCCATCRGDRPKGLASCRAALVCSGRTRDVLRVAVAHPAVVFGSEGGAQCRLHPEREGFFCRVHLMSSGRCGHGGTDRARAQGEANVSTVGRGTRPPGTNAFSSRVVVAEHVAATRTAGPSAARDRSGSCAITGGSGSATFASWSTSAIPVSPSGRWRKSICGRSGSCETSPSGCWGYVPDAMNAARM